MYCTVQDLIDRYGEDELIQLTDRADPPAGVVDAGVAEKAIADAGELIDAHLAARYTLPLATVPELLRRLACQIARYLLHDDAAPEEVRERYKDAERLLRDIGAGRVRLQADGAEPTASAGIAKVAAPERVFTRDTLGDY